MKLTPPVIEIDGESKPVGKLLGDGDSNTKMRKSGKSGEYMTAGLSLSPADESGFGNVCPNASPGCKAACLDHQGLAAVYVKIRQARKRKTAAWFKHRAWFKARLMQDLRLAAKRADKAGKKLAVRLNVFSDLPWEKLMPELFSEFPEVEFYDYTKNPRRVGQLLPNYWVTFSRSEINERACGRILRAGGNVTVVFADGLPDEWKGYPVVDGDETDLRFTDPKGGHVVGLKLKAATKAERAGAIESEFAV